MSDLPAAPSSEPPFSAEDFRAALGQFTTGVTIVTARTPDGRLVGLTANSFNSVSLAPPLVLWSLARQSTSMPGFLSATHYAINVLAGDQRLLAERFCAVVEATGAVGLPWVATASDGRTRGPAAGTAPLAHR